MSRRSTRRSEQAAMDPPAARGNRRDSDDDNDNDRSSSNNSSNNNDEEQNPMLRQFLRYLRTFGPGSDGSAPNATIDVDKARNVLEACAGNIALAGQCYWDDYLASQQQQGRNNNNAQADPPSRLYQESNSNDDNNDDDDDVDDGEDEEERRVRRRLEGDFERSLPAPPPRMPRRRLKREPPAEKRTTRASKKRRRKSQERSDEERPALAAADPPQPQPDEEPAVRLREAPADAARPNNSNHNNNNRRALMAAARAVAAIAARDSQRRRRQQQQQQLQNNNYNNDNNNGAEVSDDETAGVAQVLRMVRETTRAGRRRKRDHEATLLEAQEKLQAAFGADDGGDDDDDSSSSISSDSGSQNDPPSKKDDKDIDEDAYLSDSDWILESMPPGPTTAKDRLLPPGSASAPPSQLIRAPTIVLWKGLEAVLDTNKASILKEKVDTKQKKKDKNKSNDANEEMDEEKSSSDMEAAKESNEESSGDDEEELATTLADIPSTWLHASFSPDPTARGLALKEPKPEDVVEYTMKMQQLIDPEHVHSHQRRNNTPQLPYHCRAITAILSVVNAVMYTGASIQSHQITTSSARIPFLELSEEERKRQFESRLIDALSALIFVAAEASAERKRKALVEREAKEKKRRLKRMKKLGLDTKKEPDHREIMLERRLKLTPVVWWPEGPDGGEARLPADQMQVTSSGNVPKLQLQTSYSNISDIRAYVLSNMRSFTAPGGVALFLETIVQIHGSGAVAAMLRKAKACSCRSSDATNVTGNNPFLVSCTCEKRMKQHFKGLKPAERRKIVNNMDTTPAGHDCISVELISLLLTGKIHSNFDNWSTGPLGFGILSNRTGEVGQALMRPEKPVWVCRGHTSYSLLMMDHTNDGEYLDENTPVTDSDKNKEKTNKGELPRPKAAPCMKMSQCSSHSRSRDLMEASNFAKMDRPGYVANLLHWNCWHGQRHKSGMRLITAPAAEWKPPKPSKILSRYREAPDAKHALSLTCERKTVKQQLLERQNSGTNLAATSYAENDSEADLMSKDMTADEEERLIEQIRAHPDDPTFYPNNYRMWRFDMGEFKDDSNACLNSKPRGDHWTSYFALSKDEQLLVEKKMGPKIMPILFTRWPGATIDKFVPNGKKDPLPVV